MSGFVPVYRRRPSPLHAARAAVATAFCAAPALVATLFEHPLVLAAALAGVIAAGVAAGVGEELRRTARLALPLAALVVAINPIFSQEGSTLLVRGGSALGRSFDVTLEAVLYGGVAALRVLVLVFAFGLFSAAVDPDEVLRVLRRISYRSALTASLATRLVPALARDAGRMSDAARCRPVPPGRAAVALAALRGALDRAVEVAAALELRGYAGARRPARAAKEPLSRHDIRVASGAVLMACSAVAAKLAGVGSFAAYPRVAAPLGSPEAALAAALLGASLLPFAGASTRLGLARG